jgi:hypothetical protein
MPHEPWDGLEYESTYLELRPIAERQAEAATSRRNRIRLRPIPGRLASADLVFASVVVAYVAARDARAARIALIVLAGGALVSWARAAWAAAPRSGPFGAAVTQMVDRMVVALGMLSALGLSGTYLPKVPPSVAQALVLAVCTSACVCGVVGRVCGDHLRT